MPNKKEWKEKYRVSQNSEEKKSNKLILSKAAYDGIEGVTQKQITHTPEYEKLVEDANKKIEEGRERQRKAIINAKYDIFGER